MTSCLHKLVRVCLAAISLIAFSHRILKQNNCDVIYFTWKYQIILHFLCSCFYLFTFLLSSQFYWHIHLKSTAYFFNSPCISALNVDIAPYHYLAPYHFASRAFATALCMFLLWHSTLRSALTTSLLQFAAESFQQNRLSGCSVVWLVAAYFDMLRRRATPHPVWRHLKALAVCSRADKW